jgi:uncharacterized protein (DUF2252 family)
MEEKPAERRAAGRARRADVPRGGHAGWSPPAGRRSPVDILLEQDADRLPDLTPVRHARMAASPFSFLRGAAAVMAADLAVTPVTGITVQACGDAHLMNFGVYASPERTLLFDVNDFDETLPGPWEWDLKRLAASLVVAGRENGMSDDGCRTMVARAVAHYRERMRRFAAMGDTEVFYSRVSADEVLARIRRAEKRRWAKKSLRKAENRDSLQALGKLTERVGEEVRIVDDPPLLERVTDAELLSTQMDEYRRTVHGDVAVLLSRYRVLDAARKAVGVGSVGTRCYIVALRGRDATDALVLQIKEAGRSVLEPYVRKSVYRQQGRRVVAGQRLMQAASDVFLGWSTGPAGRHFYWRQLRDMKGSIAVSGMSATDLAFYGEVCAWTLALAHANTGDRMRIAGYAGSGDVLDRALADFAVAYAGQNANDYEEFTAAIAAGRVTIAQ